MNHDFNFYEGSHEDPDVVIAWVIENYDRERLDAVARYWHQTNLFYESKKEVLEAVRGPLKWGGIYELAIFWLIICSGPDAKVERAVMRHYGLTSEDWPTIRPMDWAPHLRYSMWGDRTEEFELS